MPIQVPRQDEGGGGVCVLGAKSVSDVEVFMYTNVCLAVLGGKSPRTGGASIDEQAASGSGVNDIYRAFGSVNTVYTGAMKE